MKNKTLPTLIKLLTLVMFCVLLASAQAATPKKLLVVTVTKGFRHSSIPTAEKILADIAKTSGAFTVDYARNDEEIAEKMTPAALKQYDGAMATRQSSRSSAHACFSKISASHSGWSIMMSWCEVSVM